LLKFDLIIPPADDNLYDIRWALNNGILTVVKVRLADSKSNLLLMISLALDEN
jgi:hypothetical protein